MLKESLLKIELVGKQKHDEASSQVLRQQPTNYHYQL
jgi:hypothetical protein